MKVTSGVALCCDVVMVTTQRHISLPVVITAFNYIKYQVSVDQIYDSELPYLCFENVVETTFFKNYKVELR